MSFTWFLIENPYLQLQLSVSRDISIQFFRTTTQNDATALYFIIQKEFFGNLIPMQPYNLWKLVDSTNSEHEKFGKRPQK